MNKKDLYQAFNEIDDHILERSEISEKKSQKKTWKKVITIAACTLLVILGGTLAAIHWNNSHTTTVYLADIERHYNKTVDSQEIAIGWSQEELTLAEQCSYMDFNLRTYGNRGAFLDHTVSVSFLGDVIGECKFNVYDPATQQTTPKNFEIRTIHGISPDLMVAVDLDGDFYVFMYTEYLPPANLGEVLDNYSLSETLELSRFSTVDGNYIIKNDTYIWEILSQCRDAKFIEDDDFWNTQSTKKLDFSATSEPLGTYRKLFSIADNGYLSTNIFDYGYKFYIGEDAANKIISYVLENCKETHAEPYISYLSGTVTKIKDNYIFVDDSILCVDPKDGMVFKIPTDSLKVSRCIKWHKIEVGDIVAVEFLGKIDTKADNEVSGVISIATGTIEDGAVMVPE